MRVLLILLVSVIGLGEPARAANDSYQTENVFVIVIDGLRQQEATTENMPFLLGGTDPDTGQPVPDPLINEAVRNLNFFNPGRTITTPGHQNILTGVNNIDGNNSIYRTQLRTLAPNWFEYYRKATGAGALKTWIVAGKQENLRQLAYSFHPSYGYPYRASFFKGEDDHPTDAEIRAEALELMATRRPSAMMLNFARVDGAGHTGNFELYINAIKTVDQIIYEIWKEIQSDPHYADKTTIFITSDHGRHSDGWSTGFKAHNGSSFGDRNIIFMALGPDFVTGEVDALRFQTDIVPTIGALVGFETPYAEGSVMTELFVNSPDDGQPHYAGRKQDVATDGESVHLVWHRQTHRLSGLFYQNTTDDGESWSPEIRLFKSNQQEQFTDVAVGTDGSIVCVAATALIPFELGGDSYSWSLQTRKSLDNGATWEDPVIVETGKTVLQTPEVIFDAEGTMITVNSGSHVTTYRGDCDGSRFENEAVDDGRPKFTGSYGSGSGVGLQHMAWAQIYSVKRKVDRLERRWNIYHSRSVANTGRWEKETRLTDNRRRSDFLAHADSTVDASDIAHVVWASRSGMSSKWEVVYKDSTGVSDELVLSDVGHSAWNPEIAYVELDDGSDRLAVIWEGNSGGSSEIYGRVRSFGVWSPPLLISADDGIDSVDPRIAMMPDGIFVTWSDNGSNGWRVRYEKIKPW